MEGENYKGINSELMEIAHEYAMAASDTRSFTSPKNYATFATSSESAPIARRFYPEPSTIGDRIKSMREVLGMSQRKLAGIIGVSGVCILKWEENTTIPGSDKIIPLSEALNCDPMWLLTGSGASQADALSHATPQP